MTRMVNDPNNHLVTELNPKMVKKIAKDMVKKAAKVKNGDAVMIIYDVGGRQLAKEMADLCASKGCRTWYKVRELEMDAILVDKLPRREIARYYAHWNNEIMQADVVFMIRAAKDPEVMAKVAGKNMAEYNRALQPIYLDYRVNHTNWQLIYWPTPREAEFEEMDFEDYAKLFFKASNQPWDEIFAAQENLVSILDKGKTLTLIADPKNPDPKKRTHLEMNIEGMTFINSTIDNNYPGSEVFSSPVKYSVNGQLFAPGKKILGHENKLVEDVYFKIKDGKIIKAKASKNEKAMLEMLNRDEGARYFGEVALGTNPGIRRQVLNPLLNEKVGGSFHITPGKAYETAEYNGKKVNVFNGNVSSIHWDLTIMMLPRYGGGEVKVDGKTIQKNGKFLIKGLEILNAGL